MLLPLKNKIKEQFPKCIPTVPEKKHASCSRKNSQYLRAASTVEALEVVDGHRRVRSLENGWGFHADFMGNQGGNHGMLQLSGWETLASSNWETPQGICILSKLLTASL